MLKKDRGTVMFVRIYKNGNENPFILNVSEQNIAGIVINGEGITEAFEHKAILGAPKHLAPNSVALMTNEGTLVDAPFDVADASEIEKVEFTVLYPDGGTKIGTRGATGELGTLLWDDGLIRKLKELPPEDYWFDNWKKNPALIELAGSSIIGRVCSAASVDPC